MYKLTQPFTQKERLDFIVKHNHNNGLKIVETQNAIYALERNEIFINNKVEINPFYDLELRLYQIKLELNQNQEKLDELDLKTIRAFREGGTNQDGIPYLELYQAEINSLRQKNNELLLEQSELQKKGGKNDLSE